MKKARKYITMAASASFLALLVTAAIAYQRGVYETGTEDGREPVQTVPNTSAAEDTVPSVTEPPVTDTTDASDDTEPTTPDSDIEPEEPQTPPISIAEFIGTLEKSEVLAEQGYSISELVYDENTVFSVLTPATAPQDVFSVSERIIKVPVKIPSDEDSGYTTEIREETAKRPAVDIYMDYLIVDKNGAFDLLLNDGTLIVEDYDPENHVPAYTRDKNGKPLFAVEEQSRYNPRNTITKYYSLNSKGEFKVNYYSDTADNRGLYFNYPSYFGKSEEKYTVHYSPDLELFGYGSENGVATEEDYRYIAAFGHSEGLCAAVETDGLMYFLNRNMVTQISAALEYYKAYGNTQRRLLREFILPDTFGEESLGFFYFDHGLCRVRAQTVDAWHWQQYERRFVNSDKDILIRTDGSVFPLPTDYNMISYSNGVILLEKNGYYGYMDYTGKWITDPVYTYARPFFEGLAVVGLEGSVGLIDTDGNYVIPPLFDHISDASCGLITLFDSECGWIILNKMSTSEE